MIGRARYRFEDERFRMGQRIKTATFDGIRFSGQLLGRHAIAGIIIVPITAAAIGAWWVASWIPYHWLVDHLPGFDQMRR